MTREERDRAADEAAQERAGAPPPPTVRWDVLGEGRYVHAIHPDHGEAVTFVPGELLPSWVVEQLKAQRVEPDEHGIYHLRAATAKPKGRRRPPRERT